MEERGNKTIICSVFFLDIVEYSKKSVSGQISQKERFNAFLSTAIRDVPINDRIILDTGDGAAISFLGDVEDALRAALSMRSSLFSEEGLMDPPLLVRMGVNLGPVRLVRDINGQPNIVGDGINVAQRVMGFAEPGQILVSRSYYDAASRLSQEYAGMFHHEGMRTDKHVREHEVYAIGYPGELTSTQKVMLAKPESKFAMELGKLQAGGKNFWDALLARYNELVAHARETLAQASKKQKAMYAGLLGVLVLLSLLLTIKLAHKKEEPLKELPKADGMLPASAVMAAQPKVPLAASAPAVTPSPVKRAASAHEAKPDAHQKSEKKTPEHAKPEKNKQEKVKQEKNKQDKTKQDKKETSKPGGKSKGASQAPGIVSLTVKPWGEVYLDGKMIDVSPPLTKLEVPAGSHVIELKNANFPVYKQSIQIKAGEDLSIRYKFAN